MTAQPPAPGDATAFRSPEETPTVFTGNAAAVPQLAPGTVLVSRYRIVAPVGRGGMGEVYRAEDLKLGQTVALKFLSGRGDAKRLYEEVRVGRQISHPNVCRLYDIVDADGHLFITMEFVDGEDLASLLRRVGRLSPEKALAVARDICAGVAAAHDKGVIHRDLKPANVMIDGRGRARVTDFGLAHFGEAVADGSGTPAYMAPEQLSGQAASFRSDIYAVGLVLYELFTGQRTFESVSMLELLRRQQQAEFERPSSVTKDVPAAVERVITKCLDPDPGSRPESVNHILRELPGGDPLAAALAAGETPTPGMVAAAAERGDLTMPVAWSWMALAVAGLLLYAALTRATTLHGRVELKSPEVLRERASEILAATGHELRRADWAIKFGTDSDHLQWLARGGHSPENRSPLLLLYRQSPRAMVVANYEHLIMDVDPPLIYSGMANVFLDSAGVLQQFAIVPPQVASGPAGGELDWTPFFRFAALRPPLAPVVPLWTSIVDSDRKSAWISADGTRVEAASYRGKPVSFQVIRAWRTPSRMYERVDAGSRLSTAGALSILVLFLGGAISLARRNLRRGQGDRRGAQRLAFVSFAVALVAGLLLGHHTSAIWEETEGFLVTVGLALLLACEVWVGYIAVEPLVRRRWPHMLISTSRFLTGRVLDPMIGRDVLIGVAIGVVVVLLRQLTALVPGAAPLQSANLMLSGVRYVGWFIGASLIIGMIGPIAAATMLVAVQAVTRSTRVSVVILAVLGALMMLGDVRGPLWVRCVFGAFVSAMVFLLLLRYGLLAYAAATFTYLFTRRIPVTLDASAWYFGRSTFALAIVIALILFGFITSLGGKRWLPNVAVD